MGTLITRTQTGGASAYCIQLFNWQTLCCENMVPKMLNVRLLVFTSCFAMALALSATPTKPGSTTPVKKNELHANNEKHAGKSMQHLNKAIDKGDVKGAERDLSKLEHSSA